MTVSEPAVVTHEADVTIVGAGPVGLSIANLLGRREVSVQVIEALPELIDYPRGVGLDDESLRSLQTMGLVDEALAHTTPNHMMRLVDSRGRILADIAPTIDEFGWPRRNAFVQPAVDRVLLDGLSRFSSARVHFGTTMNFIEEQADAVLVAGVGVDGQVSNFRSRYLVGADGGKSATRKHMQTTFMGVSPSTRWLVIDVVNDPIGTPNVWLGGDPRRPYVSLGLPHALRRFEFMLFDGEPDEIVDEEAFVNQLLAPHVPDPKGVQILRKRIYTHHSRIAGTFRAGRVLIAGDAAHLMPVWQGQGWNSGMRDATNLSWKLADVVDGKCGAELLDTYTEERLPHAKAMIDISTAFGRFVRPTNVLLAGVRDVMARCLALVPAVKLYFVQMKYKPMPRYLNGVVVDPVDGTAGRARAKLTGTLTPYKHFTGLASPVGTQFIQPQVVDSAGATRLLDDVIGYRWAMLQWGGSPASHLTPAQVQQAESMGVVIVSLLPMSQASTTPREGEVVVGDLTGRLKQWFDVRPTSLIIVRPDRFIAAAGLAQDTGRLLRAVAEASHVLPTVSTPAPESPR